MPAFYSEGDSEMAEKTGFMTKFQRESVTPGTYTDIAQVASITPPQMEREVVEVDDLNPADGVKRKLAGLIDAGEVSLTLNFDPADADHQGLESDFHAGVAQNYRIVLPGNYGWTFSGIVTGFAPSEISAGEVMQAEVTIAVTNKPVLGAVV